MKEIKKNMSEKTGIKFMNVTLYINVEVIRYNFIMYEVHTGDIR